MTTIVVRAGIMASDSLVSGGFPGVANKIRKRADCLIGFAGDWLAGNHMIESYLMNREPIRGDSDDVEILILRAKGSYLLDAYFREAPTGMPYYAIGSGSQAAMCAMNMGADAIEAIRQAIKVDEYSGGKVRHLKL